MYAICLSGALAVFLPELERWEQPWAEEFSTIDPASVDESFNALLASGIDVTEHMYLVLPSPGVPRARLASENESWFLNADGSIGPREQNGWSTLMLDLHYYLHLPKAWGMLVVSTFGAMLFALIVSGLFAHRRIIRDAFKFRPTASRSLSQLDLHNRLSVWGTPFYVVIAVTGAYFGLALPYLDLSAEALYGGDSDAALDAVFGEEPAVEGATPKIGIAAALGQVAEIAPHATPIFVTIHDAGETGAFVSVAATQPERLIYSENYLFDAGGEYLGTDGFADGETGRQIVYSLYRLHFGYFGGKLVKIGYLLLGLALSVIAVTGVNVWLSRRKTVDALSDAWPGIVWGLPLAIVISAIARTALDLVSVPLFWTVVGSATVLSLVRKDAEASRRTLLLLLGTACLLLVGSHGVRYGSAAVGGFALIVNASLLLTSVFCLLIALRLRRPASGRAAERRELLVSNSNRQG
jgi:uncharacterized iron-regulated membrane protein